MSIEGAYGKRSLQQYENTGGAGCGEFEARCGSIGAIALEQKYSFVLDGGLLGRSFACCKILQRRVAAGLLELSVPRQTLSLGTYAMLPYILTFVKILLEAFECFRSESSNVGGWPILSGPAGFPSITASALSRDTCAFDRRPRFVRSVFFVFLTRSLCFCPTKARTVNPSVERWFHQPSIRSLTTDHDSCFELPACAGRQGAQSVRR